MKKIIISILVTHQLYSEHVHSFGLHLLQKSTVNNQYFCVAQPIQSHHGLIKEQSVLSIDGMDRSIRGVTPEFVTLNIVNQNQLNPLYDAGIREMMIITPEKRDLPVVLLSDDPNRLYAFETVDGSSIIQSNVINDAAGNGAQLISSLAGSKDGVMYVITQPESGALGDVGTGIGVVVRGFITENGVNKRWFGQVPLHVAAAHQPSAFPCDTNSSVFTLSDIPLHTMSSITSYYDNRLSLLYVGISGVADLADRQAGIRGIALFSYQAGVVALRAFIPEAMVANDILIVGSGQGAAISISQLATLHTTTGLDYLIVAAGGDQKKLYSFPLVGEGESVGMLASHTSFIGTISSSLGENDLFQRKFFQEPATGIDDFAPDFIMCVGGVSDQSQYIWDHTTRFYVEGDTVCVVIDDTVNPENSGVYGSYPLFASDGRIIGWSLWERLVSSNTVKELELDLFQGGAYMLSKPSGSQIRNALWKRDIESSFAPLYKEIERELLKNNNELSCFKNLGEQDGRVGNSVCLAIGSRSRLFLAQIGTINDKALVVPASYSSILFSDDVLAQCGFITDVQYVVNTISHAEFLIVAGSNGCALLTNDDGTSWHATTGVGKDFDHMVSNPVWHLLLHNSDVIQLVVDEHFVYIVTAKQLLRCDINTFVQGSLIEAEVLVSSQVDLPVDYFTTLAIASGQLVLGTSNGLFYTDVAVDIRTAHSNQIVWHRCALPESPQSVKKVIVQTNTDRYNLQVVCVDQSNASATVVRCSLENGALHPFQDTRNNSIPTHFLNFGGYVADVMTNGASWYALHKGLNEQVAKPILVGFVKPEPNTAFLGMMPSNINQLNGLYPFNPNRVLKLPTGHIMIRDNKNFYVIE